MLLGVLENNSLIGKEQDMKSNATRDARRPSRPIGTVKIQPCMPCEEAEEPKCTLIQKQGCRFQAAAEIRWWWCTKVHRFPTKNFDGMRCRAPFRREAPKPWAEISNCKSSAATYVVGLSSATVTFWCVECTPTAIMELCMCDVTAKVGLPCPERSATRVGIAKALSRKGSTSDLARGAVCCVSLSHDAYVCKEVVLEGVGAEIVSRNIVQVGDMSAPRLINSFTRSGGRVSHKLPHPDAPRAYAS